MLPRRRTLLLLVAVLMALPVPVLEARPVGDTAPGFRRLVWPGTRFDLTFTHSVFGVPVAEHFAVDWRGRLALRTITSTDPRVIGYYDIPGARTTEQPGSIEIGGLELVHDRLTLRGTPVGGRTYEDDRCRFPLTAVGGDWGAVDLQVRWKPWLAHLGTGGRRLCPQTSK